MNDLDISLLMDGTMTVILGLRIHYAHLYESGTFMRLSLFLGFFWLTFADIDAMTATFDVITAWPGAFNRTGVFKLILMLGAVIDLGRAYAATHDMGPVVRAVNRMQKKENKEQRKQKQRGNYGN